MCVSLSLSLFTDVFFYSLDILVFGFCHGMNSFIMNFIEADVCLAMQKQLLMASTVYSK